LLDLDGKKAKININYPFGLMEKLPYLENETFLRIWCKLLFNKQNHLGAKETGELLIPAFPLIVNYN